MKKKKITFLISSLAGGGAEGVCVNIANGLARKGWEVDLVVFSLRNQAYLDRVSSEVSLINLNVKKARYSWLKVLKYLSGHRPKHLLAFEHETSIILVIIRLFSFLNFKITTRNINTFTHKKKMKTNLWRRLIVWPLIDMFLGKVDCVINQCEAMEQDLLSVFPKLEGKTCVIYNPVNKIIEDAAKKIDFLELKKNNYLLCVGRLEEQKAFHYAIQAFAQVSKKYPELRLKIVGQGSLEEQLKEEAERLGVLGKVDFEGFQQNMIPYYLGAKCTLLTSLYEGFPNVLIESISLGTPVVAFNCPSGPSEIIEEGVNGWLAEHLDLDSYVRALEVACSSNNMNINKIIETSGKYLLDNALIKYEAVLR